VRCSLVGVSAINALAHSTNLIFSHVNVSKALIDDAVTPDCARWAWNYLQIVIYEPACDIDCTFLRRDERGCAAKHYAFDDVCDVKGVRSLGGFQK
jgi:hypothetical protein